MFRLEKLSKRVPDSHKHTNCWPAITPLSCIHFCGPFCFSSEAPGSPTVTLKTEASSITVTWTKPADDGGSPITAYRVLILRGNTEIKNMNITDTSVKHQDIGGLNKNTNYTIMLFARNYVFEGKATERKIQTKYEGMKICNNNALRMHMNCIQLVDLFIYWFILINTY